VTRRNGLWRGPAADVGGVDYPVAIGGVLPGDGDVDVDAEHAGEDGGGDLGGELEQGCGAGRPGLDADLVEALGEAVGADGLAGAPTRQQPGRGAVVADGGMALAGGDQVPCQVVERLGEQDGLLTEVKEYPVIVGVNVVEGQAADGGRRTGLRA
jgi:hypothetical protein